MKKTKDNRKSNGEDALPNDKPEFVFSSDPDLQLPESVKKAWMKNVLEYEEQYKNAKYVTMREFLGNPVCKSIDQLDPADVNAELTRLMDIMGKNNVRLDFCVPYPDDVIYKFITEEFLNHEVQDIRMPGGIVCFPYEEFHPNHDYDLRRFSDEHLKSFFDPDSIKKRLDFNFVSDILLNGKYYTQDSLADFIILFNELHNEVVLVEHHIREVGFNLESNTGKVIMDFKCSLTFYDGATTEKNETISLNYTFQDDWWVLEKVDCSLFETS